MLHGSIAEIALAIAKKNEAERINKVKNEVIHVVRNRFKELLLSYEKWTAISTDGTCCRSNSYIFQSLLKFDERYLQSVAEDTGFLIHPVPCDKEVFISIPKLTENGPLTMAQQMLVDFNEMLDRRVKEIFEIAERDAMAVFIGIQKEPEKCTTEPLDEHRYSITVPFPLQVLAPALYVNKFIEIMKANGFYDARINDDGKSCTLFVKDE